MKTSKASVTGLMKTPTLPERVKQKDVKALPQSPGVYYFHDEKGELLYIGKSVNIRSRVMSHFSQDYRNDKDLRINAKLASISFESTLQTSVPSYSRAMRSSD